MVSFRNLALTASAIIGAVSAAPTATEASGNFYITLHSVDGKLSQYEGYQIETYHTGAGLADPVFNTTGTPAFFNSSHIQFANSDFPFSIVANAGDDNYARWEAVSIVAEDGTGGFVDSGAEGITNTNEEFGGWLVCEWYHAVNLPQLFQLIKGYADETEPFPSSCGKVFLYPKYISA